MKMKKQKVLSAFAVSLLLALLCGTLAMAQQSNENAETDSQADAIIEVSVPAEADEPTEDEQTEDENTDVSAPAQDIYSPDKIILTSTAWDESLGECVTGEFETLADTLHAAAGGQSLYYPTWDAGHADTFGGAMLILLHNPVSVLDPATGTSTTYPSLQFNYATNQIGHFKIIIGYDDQSVPMSKYETYAFGDYTFYLTTYSYNSGKSGVNAFATINGNRYSLTANSIEDAKRLIDSLVLN